MDWSHSWMRKVACQLFLFHAGNWGESQEHVLNLEAAPIPALALPWWLPAESRGAKGLSVGRDQELCWTAGWLAAHLKGLA